MNIIFHEMLKVEQDLKISSARLLFSTIEKESYVPRQWDEFVYNEENYRVVRISNVYEYCNFERMTKLSHIDVFVQKL